MGPGHPHLGRLPGGNGLGARPEAGRGRPRAAWRWRGRRWSGGTCRALAAMVPPREHWRLYPEFARRRGLLRHRDGREAGAGAHGGGPVRRRGPARLHPGPQHGRAAGGHGGAAAVGDVQRLVLRRAGAARVLRQALPDAGRAHRFALRVPAAGDGRRAEGDRGQAGAGAAAAPEGRERVGRGAAVARVPGARGRGGPALPRGVQPL